MGVDVDDPALGLRILEQAVADTVGSGAQPRPGQVALAEDIIETLRTNPGAELGVDGGRRIAVAATGVGKSFAQLAPAAAAALAGQRTVISTESLSLQAQLLEKDGPVIQRACETVTWRPSHHRGAQRVGQPCLHPFRARRRLRPGW